MKDGFVRIASASPRLKVADCRYNAEEMIKLIQDASAKSTAAVIFPELAVTGYTCGDLFKERTLISGAEAALARIIKDTAGCDILCGIGVPVAYKGGLYNCVAVFKSGKLLGLPAKKNIPNYSEFYESRYFSPASGKVLVDYCGFSVPMGEDMIFNCEEYPDFSVGFEICEDLWVASPPSMKLAQAGATVIMNASCSDEVIGKAEYRRTLVKSLSGRLLAAYVYADSGTGESTTDMVFAGHRIITENGLVLSESELFTTGLTYGDVDLERLVQERRRMNTWSEEHSDALTIEFSFQKDKFAGFKTDRHIPPMPFVPTDDGDLNERCSLILRMQAEGLATRLRHIGTKTAVIALSGGLDSTLALIVTVKAFDLLGLDRTGIKTVSMPCFGTTDRTKNNAQSLAEALGADFSEISIEKAVEQHFKDIGHDKSDLDITFENAQARERTQVVMDIANKLGGIVIGTGDLSELALGWATYNGDHMSMYGVNASVPKTLVRHLVKYAAGNLPELREVLLDVLDTPVSPELLPPSDGEISQITEDLVGPYELHDFFLYYMLRFGFLPDKIYRMALAAFNGKYDGETVKKWLATFYRRFFSQQFKRSCLPDGPKIGSVTLSPRGDFRMPSDASSRLWLDIVENL